MNDSNVLSHSGARNDDSIHAADVPLSTGRGNPSVIASSAYLDDSTGITSNTDRGDSSGITSSTDRGDSTGITSSANPGDSPGITSSTNPSDSPGITSSANPGDSPGITSSTNPSDSPGITSSANPGDSTGITSTHLRLPRTKTPTRPRNGLLLTSISLRGQSWLALFITTYKGSAQHG